MSRRAARIAQAEEGIAEVQQVLSSAQSALEMAERIDEAAVVTVRRSRKFLKVVLALGVLGLVAFVVMKVMSSSDDEPSLDDYSGGGLS